MRSLLVLILYVLYSLEAGEQWELINLGDSFRLFCLLMSLPKSGCNHSPILRSLSMNLDEC